LVGWVVFVVGCAEWKGVVWVGFLRVGIWSHLIMRKMYDEIELSDDGNDFN